MKVRQYGVGVINDNNESLIVHRDIDESLISFDINGNYWTCKCTEIPMIAAAIKQFAEEINA